MDTGEDSWQYLQTSTGSNYSQRGRHRDKSFEQTEVVLFVVWMWTGFHCRLFKGWSQWACNSRWEEIEFPTIEKNFQSHFTHEYCHGSCWGSWVSRTGCGNGAVKLRKHGQWDQGHIMVFICNCGFGDLHGYCVFKAGIQSMEVDWRENQETGEPSAGSFKRVGANPDSVSRSLWVCSWFEWKNRRLQRFGNRCVKQNWHGDG